VDHLAIVASTAVGHGSTRIITDQEKNENAVSVRIRRCPSTTLAA
jgi:hypothetical protein